MLIKGWLHRYYDLQDLFIIHCALPVYQMNMKRPPRFEDIVKGRQKVGSASDFSLEELEYLASEE